MAFSQHKKIIPAMPKLLDEIIVIRPSVVVLQGVRLQSPFFSAVRDSGKHKCSTWEEGHSTRFMEWNFEKGNGERFTSHIALFHHPSRGHLEKQWGDVMVPALTVIRAGIKPVRVA